MAIGEYEQVLRETTLLASSKYCVSKLDTWDAAIMLKYYQAYEDSDWDTVYEMTPDNTGCAYMQRQIEYELYYVIKEKLGL